MTFRPDARRQRIWEIMALSVLSIVAAKAGWDLGVRLFVQWQTTLYGDASSYFIVGRGILNGLTPYTDLLEIKPPGIFLLTALSLQWSGGELLAYFLQLAVTCAVPVILTVHALRLLKKERRFLQAAAALMAWIIGTGLSIRIIEKAGGIQAEAFGLFFGLLYVCAITWNGRRISRTQMILAAVCMLCSAGFKEPFLAVLLGATVLLAQDWTFFARAFIFPALLAAAAGIVLLAIPGYLGPYLFIYLPAIGDRIAGADPVWLRGLEVAAISRDLSILALAPVAGLALQAVWLCSPLLKTERFTRWQAAAAIVGTVTAVIAAHAIYGLAVLGITHGWHLGTGSGFLVPEAILCTVASAAAVVFLAQKNRTLLLLTALSPAAMYLCTLAVGAGNFLAQHYLFVTPAFGAALAVLWLHLSDRPTRVGRAVFCMTGIILLCTLLQTPNKNYAAMMQLQATREAQTQQYKREAQRIDTIMDRCGFARYYYLYESGRAAFTRHSPLDVTWTQTRALDTVPSPTLEKRFIDRLKTAPLIVGDRMNMNRVKGTALETLLPANFTSTPPACAKDLVPFQPLILLFATTPPQP